jgi:hypothetical protein
MDQKYVMIDQPIAQVISIRSGQDGEGPLEGVLRTASCAQAPVMTDNAVRQLTNTLSPKKSCYILNSVTSNIVKIT